GGGPEDGNFTIPGISFNFEIQASVVLPAGTAMSPTDLSKQIYTIPIPAKGWSPFQGLTPKVEGGKGMPSRASVTSKGDKFYIMWYAVKNSN
ncbi:MAG: hypothetical protein GY940_09945, partial [bacterium]|nr:hypothetical protein [bacterium]